MIEFFADLRNGPCEEDGSYFLDRDGLQFLFIMSLVRDAGPLAVG